MVECPAGIGANDVRIILKLGLNDRHICPCRWPGLIGPRHQSVAEDLQAMLRLWQVLWGGDPSSFGTVPGGLHVEDLLNYTSWVEILDVNLKEGEKPVEGIHWTDSLDPLFVPRSLVLADGTVAGYRKGTNGLSIVNGQLELANGCAASGIVRVFRTMLEPQQTVENPSADVDDILTQPAPPP